MAIRPVLYALVLLMTIAGPVLAVDWREYPDFKHTSGLPGNGFSVDERGKVGFGGAYHMNVPCAYTPALGEIATGYYAGSMDSSLEFNFDGDNVDGTAFVVIGLGRPGRSLSFSQVFVENNFGVNAQHIQWQFQEETLQQPAYAVGVFDLFDNREEYLDRPHNSRSFYLVTTRRLAETVAPAYVTLGWGTGRFNDRPFGAITWYPQPNLAVGAEYDGFMPRPYAAYSVARGSRLSATVGIGWSNFERPVLGLSLSYSH